MGAPGSPAAATPLTLLTAEIRYEHDVVLVRQRSRQIGALLGLDLHEQSRFATAVSEVARNAYQYAGRGRAEFLLAAAPPAGAPPALLVRVTDPGPGIAHLDEILEGRYVSPTGMGLGLLGARRLSDTFAIETGAGAGTTVTVGKLLPPRALPLTIDRLAELTQALARGVPRDPASELQQQNQELLRTLAEVEARQAEVERLNRELEETNRGVLALYAELDEKALELGRASELKSRFLSNMSHELRTPLNSIINISRLLLDHLDGPLTPEQEKQVSLIRGSAVGLIEMVNDLLDLARIEAGRTLLRPGPFDVHELLGTLRGVFRPLVSGEHVTLAFEAVGEFPPLWSDEARIAQILRNLVANAIKFTVEGEIRVTARIDAAGRLEFVVADTGIGIPAADQERIFEEYEQVEHPLQVRARGSGLGLSLSRKLARLLGGELALESEPGRGSTFRLVLPPRLAEPPPPPAAPPQEAGRA
ncbi:MAG TPA: ATP-binding protein [Gemmatimonadales bacterium]|nr:ATP-binding protein [Gemmatimonadales bacterium]